MKKKCSTSSHLPRRLSCGSTLLFSDPVRAYKRIGSETDPTRLVCAPVSATRNPSINCVTRSPLRVAFESRLTLLVNVSSTVTHGSKRHVSECADAVAAIRLLHATWRRIRRDHGGNTRRA